MSRLYLVFILIYQLAGKGTTKGKKDLEDNLNKSCHTESSGPQKTVKCFFAIDHQFPLQCDVPTKSKNWEYRWTHNDKEIDFTHDLNRQKEDGKLVVTMREEYSGSYMCVAKSIDSEKPLEETTRYNVTTAIIAKEYLMHPKFKGNNGNEAQKVNHQVEMQCMPPPGIPSPKVSWYHNNKKVQEKPGGISIISVKKESSILSTLTIPKLTLKDAGTYKCQAENIAGIRSSETEILDIHARPTIIRPPVCPWKKKGNQVKLTCVAAGEPVPKLIWRWKGKEIAGDNREHIKIKESKDKVQSQISSDLIIVKSRQSDSGTYSCTATNNDGEETSSCTLDVRDVISTIPRAPRNQTKELGETAIFECGGTGVYVYSWEFIPNNKTSFEKVQALHDNAEVQRDDVIYSDKRAIPFSIVTRKREPKNWNWFVITNADNQGRKSGTYWQLEISNITKADEGAYECKIGQEDDIEMKGNQLKAHLNIMPHEKLRVFREPENITTRMAQRSTKCSAHNAKQIIWEKVGEPSLTIPPEMVKNHQNGGFLVSNINFEEVQTTRYNGQWTCNIIPKDVIGQSEKRLFTVNIADSAKRKEIKDLEGAVVNNFQIEMLHDSAEIRFEGSNCSTVTHYLLILPHWERHQGTDAKHMPNLPEIKCKCKHHNERNCNSDRVEYRVTLEDKSILKQSVLIGIVPVWQTQPMIRNPDPESSEKYKEYLTAQGPITITAKNQRDLRTKLTRELTSLTVSLIYGSSSSEFQICKVKDLKASLTPDRRQIQVTWDKPDIKVTVGYFIDKYALRFRLMKEDRVKADILSREYTVPSSKLHYSTSLEQIFDNPEDIRDAKRVQIEVRIVVDGDSYSEPVVTEVPLEQIQTGSLVASEIVIGAIIGFAIVIAILITAFCIYQRGGVPGMGNKKSMSNRDSFIDIAPPGGLGINDVIRPIDDIHSARASSLVSIIQEPDEQLSLSGETLSINHSVYYHSQTHQEILKKYQSTRRHRDEMRRNRRKRPKQLSNRETLDPYEAEAESGSDSRSANFSTSAFTDNFTVSITGDGNDNTRCDPNYDGGQYYITQNNKQFSYPKSSAYTSRPVGIVPPVVQNAAPISHWTEPTPYYFK